LVRRGLGRGVELRATVLDDGDVHLAGELADVLQLRGVVTIGGDQDLVDSPAAGQQDLTHGMDALDLATAESPTFGSRPAAGSDGTRLALRPFRRSATRRRRTLRRRRLATTLAASTPSTLASGLA